MKHIHWIVPLSLFMVSIGGFIGAVMWVNTYTYPHIDNEKDCNDKSRQVNSKDSTECAVWDDKGKICRKGHVEDNKCESKGHVGPLILTIVSILLFIAFIVTLVMFIRNRDKPEYVSMSSTESIYP